MEIVDARARQIRTRPQWRVPKSPGAQRTRGFPVDLAVFKDPGDYGNPNAVYIIFECKAASHRFTENDEKEIKLYLQNEPAARLGVLFNGLGGEAEEGQAPRIFYKWIKKDGSIEFRELSSFPRSGEPPDLGEKGRLRKELDKAPNLRAIFRDIRNYIHSFDSRSRRDEEIIREIVKLLLCKIHDEDRGPRDPLHFRWTYQDADEDVGRRIRRLYAEVLKSYPEIFEPDEADIRLDDASIRYVVTKLQRFEITNSERHAIGDAFEVFIGDALKGKEGQYFTPRNVAETMVDFLDPSPDTRFIDPACGTGGFLVSTMNHVYQKIDSELRRQGRENLISQKQRDWARTHLRGIDLDSLCIKFSKAYTALLGDGHTGLYRADSLDIGRWSDELKRRVRFGSFDVVLTNPPFGRGLVKGGEVLRDFDLGHVWKKEGDTWIKTGKLQKKQEIGILFLELCLKLLKPGGRLGVVFLESHLGTTTDAYIPAWLLQNYTVLGVVDLPDTTFQPHTHAKICVLFIEKSPPPKAYEILMGTSRLVGHDSRGSTIYREDENFKTLLVDGAPVVADDLPEVRSQFRALRAGHDKENEFGFRVSSRDVENHILIPRYYDRSYVERLAGWAKAHDCLLISPRQLMDEGILRVLRGHGGMKSQWYGTGANQVPYVRTSNLSGLEIEYQSRHLVRIPEEIYERTSKRKFRVQADDILFVRRGEDRIGDIAIVYEGFEKILVAGEIDVLRVIKKDNSYSLTSHSLLYLLSHPLVREQFEHKMFYETIIWNIADRWLDVVLPIPSSVEMVKRISERVEEVTEQRRRGLDEIRKLYESPLLPTDIERTMPSRGR